MPVGFPHAGTMTAQRLALAPTRSLSRKRERVWGEGDCSRGR